MKIMEGNNFIWHPSEPLPERDGSESLSARAWLLISPEGSRQISTKEEWVNHEIESGWRVEKQGTYGEVLAFRANQKIDAYVYNPFSSRVEIFPPPEEKELFAFNPFPFVTHQKWPDISSDEVLTQLHEAFNRLNKCSPIPVGIVCTPGFQEKLVNHELSQQQCLFLLGIEIYERQKLTLPGEPPLLQPYRLFYDRQQLKEFLDASHG